MITYILVTVRKELWGLCCIDSWIRAKPKRRDFLLPQGLRQKGEIPRRHPSIGKYLQLNYGVSISEKSRFVENRDSMESVSNQ